MATLIEIDRMFLRDEFNTINDFKTCWNAMIDQAIERSKGLPDFEWDFMRVRIEFTKIEKECPSCGLMKELTGGICDRCRTAEDDQ
jgi:hypothetical protein